MLRNFVKVAWRNLVRHPSTSLIHVLGLSLGILSCLIIFLVIRFELSYDKFRPDADRIYRVGTEMQSHLHGSHQLATVPDPAWPALQAEVTGLAYVAFFSTWNPSATIAGFRKFEPRRTGEESPDIVVANPDYFAVFPATWLAGDPRTALSEPNRVVLTASEARRYFGSLDGVIGKEVAYDDSLHVVVSGIIADETRRTDFNFHDFISFATVEHSFLADEIDMTNFGMWSGSSQTFIKLAPGVTPGQILRQAPAFVQKHFTLSEGNKATLFLQPLSDLHFNGNYHDSYSRQASLPTLYGLGAIALFILLIACINFINLSTAQSVQRAREIGVRKVMGSGKPQLVLQFLAETTLLTFFAIGVSLLLVRPVLAALHGFLPQGVPLHFQSASTLLFLLGVALVTALGAGYYPASVLSSFRPVISLKGQGGEKFNRKSFLRRALIVFQFTISLVFIIGTVVIGRQINYMLHTDLGFDSDAIIHIGTNRHYDTNHRIYLSQLLRQIPGVSRVSLNGGTPSAEHHGGTSFKYSGKQITEVSGEIMAIDTAYLGLYQMRLVAGRNLMASDSMNEFVINETAARSLGFRNPSDAIGKMVLAGMTDTRTLKPLPIVGVVADFHSQSLHSAIQNDFLTNATGRALSVKLQTEGQGTGHFENVLRDIQAAYQKVYPGEKFDYVFFDDAIARFYVSEQKTARIIGMAMGIAIFISCMGLFGLAAFTAQQRTKEIGIRKVLGATIPSIMALLCQEFVVLVGLSILIASPLAWIGMHRWLQDYAYKVSIGAWIFVLSGFCAIIIALATVSVQALKVARANPVNSLKAE